MVALLFKETADSDLAEGRTVCFQDINGEFTRIGVIDSVTAQDGITFYSVTGALYSADELKLLSSTNV